MLLDCINSAGDALDQADRQLLLNELNNGATDDQALNTLAQAIRAELADIASRVESQGGTVTRETTQAPYLAQTKDDGARGDNHKMDTERMQRELAAKTRISAEEKAVISEAVKSAKAEGIKGVTAKKIDTRVRAIKAQYPESAGWAPLTLSGVDIKSETKKGVVVVSIEPQFKNIPYSFKEGDVDTMVDAMVSVFREVERRRAAGDRNAEVIMRQTGWYANMKKRLREEFGSLGDLFADLLGGTSPKTPVATNWNFAVDALSNALAGKYDDIIDGVAVWADTVDARAEMLQWYVDTEVANGRTKKEIKGDDIFKELSKALPLEVAPLRSNGKRFGTNSNNVAKALGNLWRMVQNGSAPKARNFSGNLIGFTDEATIDVWAARLLQDLAGRPRVPPRAEQAVDGVHLAGSTLEQPIVGGNFGFGQEVFSKAAEQLGMLPSDLQALVWFYQKEVWTKNNWTTVAGEGGSFEEQADKNPVDRFIGMLAMEQSAEFQGRDFVPTDADMAVENDNLLAAMYGIEGIVAGKSMSTLGRYAGSSERSFDLEMVVDRGTSPDAVWAEVLRIGIENKQDAVGLSRVVQPNEEIDYLKHRPGLGLYFNTPTPLEALTPLIEELEAKGIEYYTFATDARRTASVRGGAMGNVTGLRVLYVPEFMGKPDGYDQMTDEQLVEHMQEQEVQMSLIRDAASGVDGVAYAEVLYYETRVLFSEEYNANTTTTGEGSASKVDSPSWRGRTIREGFEASDRGAGVSGSDGTPDGTGDVSSVRPDYYTQSSTGDAGGVRQGRAGNLGPRGSSHKERGLPVRADGTVPLTHWSTTKGLSSLDPNYQGTGAAGAERKSANRIPRTYFGAPGYKYLSDPGVAAYGVHPYFVAVDAERLYDLALDPDGIRDKLYEEIKAKTKYGQPYIEPSELEAAVHAAGYLGFFVINRQFGPMIATFEAMPVTPLEGRVLEPVWDEQGALEEPGPDYYAQNREQAAVEKLVALYASENDSPTKEEMVEAVRQLIDTEKKYGGREAYDKSKAEGKTELNYRQWVLVRTPNFKKWFGDWEADPDNSSKVINEKTGEPLVVYHGTENGGFSTFDDYEAGSNTGNVSNGFYFTESRQNAATYSGSRPTDDVEIQRGVGQLDDDGYEIEIDPTPGIYPVFLNIRDPDVYDFEGRDWSGADQDGEFTGELTVPEVEQMAHGDGFSGAIVYNVRDEGAHGRGYGWGNSTYIVFDNRNIKSADQNIGTFSGREDIRFQGERGRYYPKTREIQLTKDSDLSTFLHESGHFFLEMQRMLAAEYGLSENQQAILDWLGVESFDDITTEHHERWAETFEVYLREGKAPSMQLRRAFASFTRWLKQIYKQIVGDRRLARADIGPEIRSIFDRLLATEDEIAVASGNPAYDQFFASQEQAGMTNAEWAAYQEQVAKVKDDAEMTLDEKVLKQYMRTKKREWIDERKPLEAEEEARLKREPIYMVMDDATVKRDPETGEKTGTPFDTEALRALFPNGKIPGRFVGKHSKEGGIDPQQYAEDFGFPSARAMVAEILANPPLKKAAQQAAEARMVEKYGDIFQDGSLEQEVREALTNEAHAKLLQMEMAAMRKANRKSGINMEYLKSEAVKMIAGMKYKDIKPNRFYRAMVKAAERAAVSELGSPEQLEAKTQQLVNHYLYKEALRVREQMEKHRRYVRSVKDRAYDTKQVAPDYVAQIKLLANMYDMRVSQEQVIALSQILDFYEGQVVLDQDGNPLTDLQLLDPNLIRALEHRRTNGSVYGFELIPFDDMTAEDLHGVYDMLRHLRFVGGQLADSVQEEVKRERNKLIDSINGNGGKDYGAPRGDERTGKRARRFMSEVFNSLPSLGNMIRKLDGGKDGGTAFKLVYQIIADANARKLELTKKAYDDLEAQIGDLYKTGLSSRDATPYVTQSGATVHLSSEQVFMLALYWGTESSREAIMENVQGATLTAFDATNLMSRLTPEQLSMVNAVWAFNESMWPDLQEAGMAMQGSAPPKLQAESFYINGVYMTGGHMQLMYDSAKNDLQREQERGRNLNEVMPTKAGSLNARRGSGGLPVLLSLDNISRSVQDKVHYIAFAQVARKVRQLIVPKDVEAAIEKKHGPAFYRALSQSISGITAPRAAQESQRWLAKSSRWIRSNLSLQILGYSVRNAVQQFGAFPLAMDEAGTVRLAQAAVHVAANYGQVVAEIHEKSKFMENRTQLATREIALAVDNMTAKNVPEKMWKKYKQHAFIMQTTIDRTIAYPTWWAVYSKQMEDHGDEKRARVEADDAVGRSVGSGADIHLGNFFQSNQSELVKSLGVFGSWFNNYYQRMYRSSNGFESMGNAQFAKDVLLMPVVVGTLSQMLIGDFPDDDEEWWQYITKNGSMFLLGTLPILREIVTYMAGFTPAQPVSNVPGSLARLVNEGQAYADDRQSGIKTVADVGRAVTPLTPLPGGGNVWRFLDYSDSYLRGKEGDFFNPVEALVEGPERDR